MAESTTIAYDTENLQRPVRLTSSLGTSTYVSDTKYTHDGKPKEYDLSAAGRATLVSYNYEYGTQRMHETRVERETVPGVDRDAVYSYDDAGNITQVTDTSRSGVDNQCFSYDYLQRLTDAWAQGADGTCADDPTAALGGPAPYWQSFTYDDAGNRTQEAQHNADGSVSATRTYTYSSAGQGHKLTAITQTGTGAHTESYGYDDSGNTTTRNTGTSNQTLTWDTEGELSKVSDSATGDTSFVYDTDGNRLLRREASATTLYMGNEELRLDKASGTVAATRYYEHNDQVVAMRTTAGVQLLATDKNDTAEEAVDATSLAITQRRFTPFGQARGAAVPSWPGDKGFVDGTKDATTGLTHLGAREYDPATGRFISVDPVFDLSDPQSWNGYAYSDNSPVTHSDPDGQMIVDPGGGGSHSTYNPDNDDRNTVRRLGAIARYGINYGPLRVQYRLLAHDRALHDIQAQNPIIARHVAPVQRCDSLVCKLKHNETFQKVQSVGRMINSKDNWLGRIVSACSNWAPSYVGAACGVAQGIGYAVNGEGTKAAGAFAGAAVGFVGGKYLQKGIGAFVTNYRGAAKAVSVARRVKSIGVSRAQERVVKFSLNASSSLHMYAASNLTNTLITGDPGWSFP